MYKRFRTPMVKTIQCQCGNALRLINRRNFPHGRKSVAVYSSIYKCSGCNSQRRATKPALFKR